MDKFNYESESRVQNILAQEKLYAGTELVRMGDPVRILMVDSDPNRQKVRGLRTVGISTCTAYTGYFHNNEGNLGLFLAHVQPSSSSYSVFRDIKLNAMKDIKYLELQGSRVDIKRWSSVDNKPPLRDFFRERRIQATGIPFNEIEHANFAGIYLENESLGLTIRVEYKDNFWKPVVTIIKEN